MDLCQTGRMYTVDFYKTYPESDSTHSLSKPYEECSLCYEIMRKREESEQSWSLWLGLCVRFVHAVATISLLHAAWKRNKT